LFSFSSLTFPFPICFYHSSFPRFFSYSLFIWFLFLFTSISLYLFFSCLLVCVLYKFPFLLS
jgi:hypothetical protein